MGELNNNFVSDYNKLKRNYLKLFKECNYDIQKALDFKETSIIWKSLFY